MESCATREVAETVDLHRQRAGKDFAKEVSAQSPFKSVTLDWDEAKELMYDRNMTVTKANKKKKEATARSPLMTDLISHLQSSVGETARGALSPEDLVKVARSPFEELPKHLRNLASLKDFSHEMQLQAYDDVKDASKAEQTIRQEIVTLQAFFVTGTLLKKRADLLEQWESDESSPAKLKTMLKKDKAAYLASREKWLDQIRDFFNAEYADVKFSGVGRKFLFYRNVSNPHFENWQRWRVLQRSEKLATGLKKLHDASRPMVPGTNLAKTKVLTMLNVNPTEETLQDPQEVRSSVRGVLKNWRELKEQQAEEAELKKKIDVLKRMETLTEAQQIENYSLAKKLLDVQQKELSHAKELWLIDEQCWKDLSS